MTKSPFLSFLLSFQMWSGPALDRIISRTMVEGGGDRIKISAHLWFDRELIMLGIFFSQRGQGGSRQWCIYGGTRRKVVKFLLYISSTSSVFFCIYFIKITHFLLERCPQYSLPTYCRSSPHTSKINIGANTNITENVNEYGPTNTMFTYDHQHDFTVLLFEKRHFLKWMVHVWYEKFKWYTCKTLKQIKFEWMDVIHLILNTPLWKCSRVNLDWL